MSTSDRRIRVAIACQGGGSHTAFSAGVLGRLLESDVTSKYEIVGLSGTSGGAICATLAWSALVDGEPEKAASLLKGFWAENSASSVPERMMNAWMLWAGQVADYVSTPSISPYNTPTSVMALDQLRSMLEHWMDFDRQNRPDGDPTDGDSAGSERPLLVLGAVDVLSGVFKAFDSRRGEITVDALLASAAIPQLFRSVPVGDGVYWDGLFSQNPPVRDLLSVQPDEIWVIQINPQERSTEPRTIGEITDRRNELAGNLSMYQELHSIEKIDRWLEEGILVSSRYRPVAVRIIEKSRSKQSQQLGAGSKLNRDPDFLNGLIENGAIAADQFVTALAFENAWSSGDAEAVWDFFADDCEITSQPPFEPVPAGPDAAWQFVTDGVAADVHIDLTRRQYAGDTSVWRVRSDKSGSGTKVRGQAEAKFENGKITKFALGPSAKDGAIDRRVVL